MTTTIQRKYTCRYRADKSVSYPKIKDENGVERTIKLTFLKLYVRDYKPIGDSGYYRITRIKRRGRISYVLAVIPLIDLSDKVHYEFALDEQYKNKESMIEAEFRDWLRRRLGPETQDAWDKMHNQ